MAALAIDWGALVLNVGLSVLAFLTVFLFNAMWRTLRDNERELTRLDKDLSLHLKNHPDCQSCTCRTTTRETLDHEDHRFDSA